ncbi:DUF5682 family protein [Amycolatopsis kentuckyensis]|uniref:DUF5682 family protein n=1 Tax=Amycolatopsis kentuckyensis TaxID=218823 RepID=UPI000A3972CE|nr:DUF5682 family protein [Amycolatopsis kentuckyensis]
MGAVFVGVRHHSPACSQVVASAVAALRPAYVLVEGPADVNDRLGELLLGHELPIAIHTSYSGEQRTHSSWSPFCDHSPEWIALTAGRDAGAELRFIDLPAWHPAFEGWDNRYADAELRYTEVIRRLCAEFAVDNADSLWDHLFEAAPEEGLADRLTAYFDLLRGEAEASESDREREEYMAAWVRAAVAAAGDRPVLVVTGGFHTAAVRRLAASGGTDWPEVPRQPGAASYLVPYSHRRLDAFTGYQSGMPSPGYYQLLWERGLAGAGQGLLEAVAGRLRERRQPVSTADLIAARALADGLAKLRGHDHPARVDVLDGLLGALVTDDLTQPPPWTVRGPLQAGAHPVVVEMVAALGGDRRGRLHPDTPAPPLPGRVEAELAELGLDGAGPVRLDLTEEHGRRRSRVLHCLRLLGIPGFDRRSGPAGGADPVVVEVWRLTPGDTRLPALIEAGAYGATLPEAALAVLREGLQGADLPALARALFDAALCGVPALPDSIVDTLVAEAGRADDLGPLGDAVATVLALWRHDALFGLAGSPAAAAVLRVGVARALWLAEAIRGGPAPAEPRRLAAMVAVRDTIRHAAPVLTVDRETATAVAERVAADAGVPPDLRGAAAGLSWSLGGAPAPDRTRAAVRDMAAPTTLGDWLAGLFALAREEVIGSDGVLDTLDELVSALSEAEFLAALPALRLAFAYFPPAEREKIAERLLARHGRGGSARTLVRPAPIDPMVIAEARALEARVDARLTREGLA